MEKLTTLLDAAMKDCAMIQDALADACGNNIQATRNAELRQRLRQHEGTFKTPSTA